LYLFSFANPDHLQKSKKKTSTNTILTPQIIIMIPISAFYLNLEAPNNTSKDYPSEYLRKKPIHGELVVAIRVFLWHHPFIRPEDVPSAPVHRAQVRRLRQLPTIPKD
jgi:hypothetical protein